MNENTKLEITSMFTGVVINELTDQKKEFKKFVIEAVHGLSDI